jgi:hypothetical protein
MKTANISEQATLKSRCFPTPDSIDCCLEGVAAAELELGRCEKGSVWEPVFSHIVTNSPPAAQSVKEPMLRGLSCRSGSLRIGQCIGSTGAAK